MESEARVIRDMVAALDRRLPTTPYPAEIRHRVGRYAQRRRDQGCSWHAIARETGISINALQKWTAAVRESRPPTGLVPVQIRPCSEETIPAPVLITPGGYRVEGLDLAGCALLLQSVP